MSIAFGRRGGSGYGCSRRSSRRAVPSAAPPRRPIGRPAAPSHRPSRELQHHEGPRGYEVRATGVAIGREQGGHPLLLRRQILAQPGDPAPVDVAGVNRVARAVARYRVGDELRRHAVVDQRVIELESRQG